MTRDSSNGMKILFSIALISLTFVVATAQTRYVKVGGAGNKDGSSWANASGDLQAMINGANINDEIWVAEGTYKPTHTATGWSETSPTGVNANPNDRDNAFVIKSGVKIYGGFPANANATDNSTLASRNWVTNKTILSGELGGAAATDNAYHVVMITSGDMNGAILDGFTVSGGYSTTTGAGIYANGSNMTFVNLIITGNTTNNNGGAIYLNNSIVDEGFTFTNILVFANNAGTGGGAFIAGGMHSFNSFTFANNTGGVAVYASNGTLNLNNSIIWGNAGGVGKGGTANIKYAYNLVQGGTINGTDIVANTDPLFNADYSLQPASPAIDMGNDALLPAGITTDILGNQRSRGCRVDLGACEAPPVIVPTNGRVYVKKGGAGNKDGSSWENAYPNLTYPFYIAKMCNITSIWVAEGVYFPDENRTDRNKTFIIPAGVKIYGGFNGLLTGSPAVPQAFGAEGRSGESVFNGDIGTPEITVDNSLHVVTVSGDMNNALLDGFTVSGGNDENGSGGGILADGSNMTFANLTIKDTYVRRNGSGIYLSCSSATEGFTFTNIVLYSNYAYDYGGGVFIAGGTHNFTNITFVDNSCNYGAAAIHVGGGTMNLRNSIVWGSISGNIIHSYNLVQGSAISGTDIVAINDPMFVDAANRNYRLKPESPAVDVGNSSLFNFGTTDIEGNVRVKGCNIDLGAYESTFAIVTSSAKKVYVKAGGTGKADGSSWDNAYPNLSYPLRMAKICGIKEIWVAEGTYYPMFALNSTAERDKTFATVSSVKIYGGFNGTLTGAPVTLPSFGATGRSGTSTLSGDIDKNNILDAGNVLNVVTVSGDMSGATLDGFTISGGHHENGSGGGILANGHSMTFTNLTVKNTYVRRNGSGIHLDGSSATTGFTFTNIVVTGNYAYDYGGGAYIASGTHNFTNITFAKNSSNYGGSAIYVGGGTMNLRNSIVWEGNIAGTVNHFHNLVQGATLNGDAIVSISDPLFVDFTNGDFRLNPESPAINKGDKTLYLDGKVPDISSITTDIAGKERIQGYNVDLGAYEASSIVPINGRVYVKEGGTGKADGSSWDDAYPNLAYPLYMAAPYGITEIWVAEGTYYPMYAQTTTAVRDRTFYMLAGVKVYGGFNGLLTGAPVTPQPFGVTGRKGESTLSGDIDENNTLDAGNVINVVTASGDMNNALLDGFTITGGHHENGSGGGILADGSNMTFANLTIKDTYVRRNGSGIYLTCSSATEGFTFTNIVLYSNYAYDYGGGAFIAGGTHNFTNITFADNSCNYGGAAIHVGGGTMNLRNSIVWGSISGNIIHSYNLVQGGAISGTDIVAINDPMFVDAANRNYRLKPESHAIDMGNASLFNFGTTDMDGNTRVRGCEIDLGAYEASVSIVPTTATNMVKRVYVKAGGVGKADGSSWENAYPNLAYPLRMAKICGINEIWVAEGTYYPMYAQNSTDVRAKTFYMDAGLNINTNLKIYGGFNGILTGSPINPQPFGTAGRSGTSILNGDINNDNILNNGNVYHVVTVSGDMKGATLDGFIVTGGHDENGSGGGILADGSNMTFTNLIIKSTYVRRNGSGIYLSCSNATEGFALTNIVLYDNYAYDYGGGVFTASGTHTFTNTTFANNSSNHGGSAIYVGGGTMHLHNSIVWGGSIAGTVNHSYNLVQGATLDGDAIVSISDPLFVDAANGDFRLKPESPAINIGDKTWYDVGKAPDISSIRTDIAGNARIQGYNIDLGAYEISSIMPTNGIVYVKEGGVGKADGSSWDNAYPNLAYPLRMAASYGITEIWVAEGTYYPMYAQTTTNVRDQTFYMLAGVRVYGGFNGNLTGTPPTPPQPFGTEGRNGISILSGDIDKNNALDAGNVYHVVTASGYMGNTLLEGFTISGGHDENGSGGGILADGSNMTFANLTIKDTYVRRNGSGIYLNCSGATEGFTFTNIVLYSNYAYDYGGGVFIAGGTHNFTNITFVDNSCNYGGTAIHVGGGTMNLRNSIVWGSISGNIIHSYNLVQGGSISGTGIVAINDPMFVDAGNRNYRLRPESPAIDLGNASLFDFLNKFDIGGNARVQGCAIDLGAYESPVAIVPLTSRKRVFVKAGGTGKADGSSWDNAYPNLAYPLRMAKICDIREIWVAEGTYYPMYMQNSTDVRHKTFYMVEGLNMVAGLKIYGGFNGKLTGAPSNANPPAIGVDGRSGESVLSGDIDKNNILDAGNVYHVVTVAGNMNDARFEGFTVTGGHDENGSGGGIYVEGNNMTFVNLTIKDTYVRRNGSGIYLNGLNATAGCTFTNIVLTGNYAYDYGGGTFIADGTHNFTNITFANNSSNYGGSAIYVSSGTMNLRNSIVWAGSITGTVNHSFNLVQGASGTGIISNADPLFVNSSVGNYRLQANSPAIDVGDEDLCDARTDIVGVRRVNGANIDLGAYETTSITPSAKRVYVKEGGVGKKDGSSWDNAYPNLADPLLEAGATPGSITEIWVAEGTYYPLHLPTGATDARDKTFVMVENVKIYGGFNGVLTGKPTVPQSFGSVGRNGISTLSGDIGTTGTTTDNVYHIIIVSGDMGGALLDGFTVARGNTTGAPNSSITVNGNAFSRRHGAGIVANGAMTFSNLKIIGNDSRYDGGGIYLNNTNSSEGSVFTNVIVAYNSAYDYGGGVYVEDGTHYFTNATFTGNEDYDYGAIYVNSGSVYLSNSIIWDNWNSSGYEYVYGDVYHHHNLLQDGPYDGTDIVSIDDPMFVDPLSDDYSLQPGSPAIDVGDATLYGSSETPNISYITTDISGNPRVHGSNIDLGAYEIVPIVPTADGIVYVKEGGAGNADGSSWDNAYPNLADPLLRAKQYGVTAIWVAEGTYYPMYSPSTAEERDKTFLMVENVKVYGGFNGTLTGEPTTPQSFGETGRSGESILSGDIDDKNNILDAGNVFHVVTVVGDMGSALLDGFTVTGGYSTSGTSTSLDAGSIVVNGVNVTRYYGAGVSVTGAMTFTNIRVKGNTGYYGGGMFLAGSGSVFTNMTVDHNTTLNGGGGGVYVKGGANWFTNVTVADNKGATGGGIYVYNSVLNIRNSIVWGNTKTDDSPDNIYTTYSGVVNHSYNLIQGEALSGTRVVSNSDPLFVSSVGGDYHLQPASPAINVGDYTLYDNGKVPDIFSIKKDFAGNDRQRGCAIDLGPYEETSVNPVNGRVYVKEGGSGDGSSWANAYPDLAVPLRMAKICNVTEIWVAEGTYYPMFSPSTDVARDKTFLMVENVKIYGGFNAPLAESADPPVFGSSGRNGVSILSGDIDQDGVFDDGDNVYHVVTVSGSMSAAVLDGFTVTGGHSSVTDAGYVTVNGNTFSRYNGAGIAATGVMTFRNLRIKDNTAYYGGGIYLTGGAHTFTNVIIVGNTALNGEGGGTYITGGTHTFTNVTFTQNSAVSGGAIFVFSNSVLNLRNSIVWNNTNTDASRLTDYISNEYNGTVNLLYNLVEGVTLTTGDTKIVANTDPAFVNPAAGDYSLQPESPAIDKGSTPLYPSDPFDDTDIAGNTRRQGCEIDLGAHESSDYLSPTSGRVYVKEGASGDGSSWNDAYPNLAYPLRMATICGITEIWVAEGDYYPMFPVTTTGDRDKTFLMVAGVKIYGGFNGTLVETTDPPAFGTTGRSGVSTLNGDIDKDGVLDDGNVYHVVTVSGDMGAAALDGFTISGGYSVATDVGNVVINGNAFSLYDGGGIAAIGSMTFSNLTIAYNTAYHGGGVYLQSNSSGFRFINAVFADNTAQDGDGGGVCIKSGTHVFTNVTITKNRALDGGAMYIYNSTLNLNNSIVWGNTDMTGSAPNNISEKYYGVVNHSRNLLQGAILTSGDVGIVSNTDPLFVDALGGDYRLQHESPAIDMGNKTLFTAASAGTTDIAGKARVQGVEIDLGVHESSDYVVLSGGRVYVIPGGAGNKDGSSWDNAYPDFAFPLRMAKVCGITEIWVAEGTYYPMFSPTTAEERDYTFLMAQNVKIYGGFSGHLTGAPTVPQHFGANGRDGKSLLSGNIGDPDDATDNVYHVVTSSGDMGNALLDGFTISDGYSAAADVGTITVNGNSVTRYYGSGITVNGYMNFTNIRVEGNRAYYGGGVYLDNTSAPTGSVFTNVIVAGDTAQYYGGGVYARGGEHWFTNVTIADNTGEDGAAIYVYNSTLNLRNSIVWGNTNTQGSDYIHLEYYGRTNHYHNLLEGYTLITDATDIVANTDPLFTDAPNGDYSLQSESSAIDRGDQTLFDNTEMPNISVITTDVAGYPRVQGADIDLGAHEGASLKPTDGIVYVIPDGKGDKDGSSWDNAYPNLSYPLLMAKVCNIREIWVAEGEYYPMYAPTTDDDEGDKTFLMVEDVKVYGGFNGTLVGAPKIPQVFGATGRRGESILNGEGNVYHVVLSSGDMGEALLDGFTVTGGYSSSSSGNIIVNSNSFAQSEGAGIAVVGSMTFTNLRIKGNTGYHGGGVYLYNTTASNGTLFTNIVISENSAQEGGGVHIRGGSHIWTNVTVADNQSDAGGAMYVYNGTLNLRNSIIWGNRQSSDITIHDNISEPYYGTVNHHYNLLEDGVLNGTRIIANANPLFASGDYSPITGSPAIDVGDRTLFNLLGNPNLSAITRDIVGNPRISGSTVDLGAFELAIPIAAVNDTAATSVDRPVTIDALANDKYEACGGSLVSIALVAGSGPNFGTAAIRITPTDTFLVYTPNADYTGEDSFEYEIGCGGMTVSATVYVLTVKPLSKDYYACTGELVEMGYVHQDNVTYIWYDASGTTQIKSSSDTIKRVKDASGATQIYLAQPVWRGNKLPFDTVKLHPSSSGASNSVDIRVTICPSPTRFVYLTNYLDTLSNSDAVNWTSTGNAPAILDATTGKINTANIPSQGTFTYVYTRSSQCSPTPTPGKAYVHVLRGRVPPRRETMVICRDKAAAINVNSIFGFDFDGVWKYNSPTNPDNLVADNTTATTLGAIIFNGDKAFADAPATYNTVYNGVAAKQFVFEYDYSAPGNCAAGKIRITIVVWE